MRPKDFLFLIWDSFVALIDDMFQVLASLKSAKTWSFILWATFLVGAYYRNFKVMYIALPLIVVVYIIRRKNEGDFNRRLKERAFLQNDEVLLRNYYDKYVTSRYYSGDDADDFKTFKEKEIKKLKERRYT